MGDMTNAINWTLSDVEKWCKREQIDDRVSKQLLLGEGVDGKCLLALNETDIRDFKLKYDWLRLGDLKHLWISVRLLQKENHVNLVNLGLIENYGNCLIGGYANQLSQHHQLSHQHHHCSGCSDYMQDIERSSPPLSIDGRATSIKPEIFKTMISLGKSADCDTSNS